jgi:hypothetical protein
MSEQYIFRKHREKDWTIIPNDLLQDKTLSWEARGLLCYLISRPKDWAVRKKDLENQSPVGEYAVATILKELEEARYIYRQKTRNKKGQWVWITWVFDEPYPIRSSMDQTGDIQSTDDIQRNTTSETTEDIIAEFERSKEERTNDIEFPDEVDLHMAAYGIGKRQPHRDFPPDTQAYAKEFIRQFGREPTKSEKSFWIKEFRHWSELGVKPEQVPKMVHRCKEEGTAIKSPKSITWAFDELRTSTTSDWEDDLV